MCEISIQEVVTLVLPELWINKAYPKTIFVDVSGPSKRYSMCKSEDLLSKLDSNGSNNVFKRNNLDQDKNRPDSGISHARYVDVDQMSYAEFCAFCSKVYIDNTNGSKPVILGDELEDEISETLYQ